MGGRTAGRGWGWGVGSVPSPGQDRRTSLGKCQFASWGQFAESSAEASHQASGAQRPTDIQELLILLGGPGGDDQTQPLPFNNRPRKEIVTCPPPFLIPSCAPTCVNTHHFTEGRSQRPQEDFPPCVRSVGLHGQSPVFLMGKLHLGKLRPPADPTGKPRPSPFTG